MGKLLPVMFTALLVFATLSSSSNYGLNSYSVGPAGTSNSHSTTYYTQSTGGEASGNSTTSTHNAGTSGGVQAEQLAVPQAPTVSNGSGAYYNHLLITLNDNAGTNAYPADVTFSIGVSTVNCFTSACVGSGAVKFVQTGGSLGGSQFYQTYSAWGSGSGTSVVGLVPSTTYYVAVAAEQGTFTNTEYSASSSVATASPSLTFSVTPNTLSFSSLLPGTTFTSGTVTFSLATNAAYGANIYNAGQNGGLHSILTGSTIPALSGNLATSSHGFGLQGLSASQTSGGPLSIDSPYNGTGNTVGTESAGYTPTFTTSAAITGGSATLKMQAKAASNDPASSDYGEVITFLAAASF
ncbi:MAG TPA: hypothetical protein VGM08_03760 [Candidatus Saccharimonadales bacterium]|jgi:hypothetical protein